MQVWEYSDRDSHFCQLVQHLAQAVCSTPAGKSTTAMKASKAMKTTKAMKASKVKTTKAMKATKNAKTTRQASKAMKAMKAMKTTKAMAAKKTDIEEKPIATQSSHTQWIPAWQSGKHGGGWTICGRRLQSKMIATFCYKNYTKSMIAYDIRNVIDTMKNPHLFEEMHLSGTEKSVPLLPEWTRAGISEVVSARALCTPKSTFFCGDVLLSMQNGSMSAGRAIAFLRITQGLPRQRGRELRYLALLENMQKIVGAIYTLSGGDPVLNQPVIFFASVPFRRIDATFHLALPIVLPV